MSVSELKVCPDGQNGVEVGMGELELYVGLGRANLENLRNLLRYKGTFALHSRLSPKRHGRYSQWECHEHVAYPVGPEGPLRYTCHESVICYLKADQDRTCWGISDYGAFRRVMIYGSE